MPELPEVETVARQLDAVLPGRKLRWAEAPDKKYAGIGFDQLLGKTVKHVQRMGKHVLVEFGPARSPVYLSVHLRMTGRLIWIPGDDVRHGPLPLYGRVAFGLTGGVLWFCDLRRFGVLETHQTYPLYSSQGVDPLTPGFTAEALAAMLEGARGEIKPWLLRQDKICGIGNIYASEILFAARLSPQRSGLSLSLHEIRSLHKETVRILKLAVKHCGTTFSDFQDSRGELGGYQRYLKAYNRAGQPCPDCAAPICRMVQQQRSTYYCESCQH